MDDKLKVFWNLDVLVKMCRSKSDGPSLRIEEEEIVEKIEACNLDIEEIRSQSDEESYDTSAEMADRNIEIITKKQLQTLKNTLKEKNKELNSLKEEEQNLYSKNSLLRENKISQEKYILSMQERINEATDYEVIDRYNGLIAETTEKISILVDDLEEHNETYEKIQQAIVELSEEITNIEDSIDKKKKLLAETQANLENRENYIDKSKKEKTDKKIAELESKIQKATSRLEEIRKDPKYLESKIKDIINDKEDIENAKPYLIQLINTAVKVPYINVPADNALEEELLKATQARDSFANEIEQKSYNVLETNTPEKVRIEFLNERITLWSKELEELKNKVDIIDRDQEYNYESKNQTLQNMIQAMKKDLKEYEKAYAQTPDMSVGAKASIKAALDEKRIDLLEAEKIVTAFRKDESNDIARATKTIKYECERLYQNIQLAEKEIETIKNRLTSKKSGLIDIGAKNKDKDTLKELAQTVIDIKHRRQFPETPLEIVKRLETELDIRLMHEIDGQQIESTSNIVKKDYEEFNEPKKETKRGIKVIEETEVETKIDDEEEGAAKAKMEEAEAELQSLINDIEEKEKTTSHKEEPTPVVEEESVEIEAPVVEEVIPVVEEEPVEIEAPVVEEAVPVVEEEPVEIEAPVVEEVVPVVEEEPIEIEAPVVEETVPVVEETPVEIEAPVIEETVPVIEEPVEIEAPVIEETVPVVEEETVEIEAPVVEEAAPVVEEPVEIEAPVVEEVVPVVEETPVEIEAPVVEEVVPVVEEEPIEIETPVIEEVVPVVEETPVVEQTPVIAETSGFVSPTELPVEPAVVEPTIVEEPTIVVEEEPTEIEVPVVEATPAPIELVPTGESEPTIEELPVEMPLQAIEEEDEMLDQQIDDIILSTKNDVNEDDQPLDIDAMFAENTETKEEVKETAKKLSIDTIFNVETDKIDSEDTNENLANDFDQYINDLGNKEA